MTERNADVSKTLTEQWKKGELPFGWYYIKIADIVFIDFFEGKVWKNKKDKYVDKVFAEVPSYEQWQQLKEYEQVVTSYNFKPIDYEIACETVNKLLDEKKELRQENTKLKDLLKEIRGKLHYINTPVNQHNIFSNDFIKRLDQALGE